MMLFLRRLGRDVRAACARESPARHAHTTAWWRQAGYAMGAFNASRVADELDEHRARRRFDMAMMAMHIYA